MWKKRTRSDSDVDYARSIGSNVRDVPRERSEIPRLTGSVRLSEWTDEARVPAGFAVREVVVGRDDAQLALEVVVLDAGPTASMSREALGSFHAARLGRRVSPVVVVARRSRGRRGCSGRTLRRRSSVRYRVDQAQRMLQIGAR